jgi:hypothetical protein
MGHNNTVVPSKRLNRNSNASWDTLWAEAAAPSSNPGLTRPWCSTVCQWNNSQHHCGCYTHPQRAVRGWHSPCALGPTQKLQSVLLALYDDTALAAAAAATHNKLAGTSSSEHGDQEPDNSTPIRPRSRERAPSPSCGWDQLQLGTTSSLTEAMSALAAAAAAAVAAA